MMQGLDSSFDLVIFVGYHAMAGAEAAVMNHTWYGRMVDDVWINGDRVGESAINAGIAGYFNVPVGAVTGDDKVANEATKLLGNIETAVVKEGIDRFTAKCFPLTTSRQRIKEAANNAIKRREEFKPLKYSTPVSFKVRFASTSEAATACWLPMVKKEDPRTVSFNFDDYLDAFHTFHAVLALASTAQDKGFG
jgi:D-amino peptidase